MSDRPVLPIAVRIVAVLFALYGLEALVETVVVFVQGRMTIPHPGVFALLIAVGILRGREGWRICALVLLTLPIIGSSVLAVRMVMGFTPPPQAVSWLMTEQPPRAIIFSLTAIVLSLAVWQYRTLQRSDVREFFQARKALRAATGNEGRR